MTQVSGGGQQRRGFAGIPLSLSRRAAFRPGAVRGIKAPRRGANTAPTRRGLRPPGPPGAAPPAPCRAFGTLGRLPRCCCPVRRGQATGGKRGLSDHGGERLRSERSGSRRLAGGQPLAVVHGPPRRGAPGVRKPPPGIQHLCRRHTCLGWRSRPLPPAGAHFLAQQGIVSTPMHPTGAPNWPTKLSSASKS